MTIKEYIIVKNVTFTSIAKLVPCAPQYISMLANNKANPSYRMAKRIEEITGGLVQKENWYPNE